MPLYAKTYAPLSDEPIEDDGLLDEFAKGFGAGVDQTQALGGGFLALAGSAFGNDDWFYDGLDYYNEQMAEAAENEGSVQRVEDIEGAGDLLAYTAYTAGNLLPSIAGAAVTGGVGAAGAKFVGDRLIKSKLKDMADELVKKNAKAALVKKIPQNYRDQVLAGVGRKGAVAGAVGFGAVLGGGENFMRQLEENGEEAPGIAFATGIVSGSLDALVPLKALKRILPEKAFAKARSDIGEKVLEQRSLMRRMATEGLKASGMEGLTEATQEFVQNVSVGWVKANLNPEDQDAFIDTVFGETAQSAYLNAFVAGAIGGGTVGSLTGIARDDISRPRTPGDNLTTDDLLPEDDSPLGLPRPDQVGGPRGNRRTRDRDTKESDTETERVRRAAGMPPERDNPEQIEPDLTVDVEGNVFEDTSPEAKRERATDNARAELEGGAERQPRGIFERRESLDLRIKVRAEQEQERLRVMIQARRDAQQSIRDAMEEGSQPPLPEGTERVQGEFNADAEQEQQDRTREQAVGLNADIEADMGVLRDQPTFMRNRVREAAIDAGDAQTAEDPLNITWIPKDPNDPNDMNRFTLRGKTYGYVGVETNDDGTTTGILATEANGDEAVIRTKIPRTKIERLRIEAEQSQAEMDGEVDTGVLPPIVQKKIKDQAEAEGVPMPETVPVQVALDAAEDAQNETDSDVLSNTDSAIQDNVVFKPIPVGERSPPEITAENPIMDSTPPFNGLVSGFKAGKETFDPERYNKEYAGRSVQFEGEETPIVLPEFTETDARKLQEQMEGIRQKERFYAPGGKTQIYTITPPVNYATPENTPESQRLKIAIQDLIASGMPKQVLSMADSLRIFTGSAAFATFVPSQNRVMVNKSLVMTDSVVKKKLLRFSLVHEYSHALDTKIGYTNTDPEFNVAFGSFNSDTKELNLDVGEVIGEMYRQYTENNPVGRVMLYPFYQMQKKIQANPKRTEKALTFLKREVFAQSFALFIADPKALKQYAPKTFAYMQKLRRDERITNYGQDSNQANIAQPDNRRVREGVRTPTESGSPTGDDAGGARPASGSSVVQGETGARVEGPPNDQVRDDDGRPVRGQQSATVTPFYGRDNTFSVAMPDGTEYTLRRDDDGSIVNEETGDVFTGEPGRASILDIDGTMVRIPGSGPANIEEMVVSTRFPTAVKAPEDPVTDVLVNDYAGYTANESVFSKNMALVKKYNNLTKKQQRLSDKSAAETLIDHVKSNLLSIFDAVPESTREISKQWYKGANKIVQRMADRHGVSLAQASAVAANLSPQKDWYQNASLAERVLDIFHSQKSSTFDGQMQDKAEEIYFHKGVSDKARVSNREMLDLIGDKSLQNLIDEGAEKDVIGMWIRTWDQTYNDPAYRLVSPDGKFLEYAVNADGETKSRVAWGSLNEIGKSVSVLLDSSQENISRSLGSKNKVRNFYNNIFEPDSQSGFVTIDTHAVAAGLLKPLAGDSLEVSHNFGTGKGTSSSSITGHSGTYSIFEEAYRQAAEERGVLAREMQSITWEAVRGLFTPTYKAQRQNVLFVEGVWNQYSNGKLSLDEARNKINEHSGGIQRPAWERSDFTVPDEVSETSYQRKLPDNSVSGPPLGPQETAGRGAGVDATGVSPAQGLDRRPEQTRDPNSDTFGEVLTVDDIEFSMAPEIQAVADKVLSRPNEDVTVKEKASRYVKDVKTNPQGYLASKWQGFVQGVFDDVNRVGYNEKQLTQDGKLKDGAESAYKAALWTKNLETTMQSVMFGGPLELRDGAFQMVEGEGSFYDIFEGYDRNQLKEWELWAAANRAKRLKTEDRENLFSQKDIDTVLRAAERNGTAAQYKETLAKWTKFNRKILDLAEQSGVLDPQKRAAWDRDDYVPFFRFDDEADTNDLQNDAVNIKNGLMNQGLNIKRLEGGEGKINPLESMVSQLTTMIDRSFKNEAMRRIARDNAELGTMVEVTASDANIELASNPDKSELIKVYDGGKARVFQVKDPMLLRSIGGLGGYKLDKMAQAFAIPKQVLTRSVTIDPGFMIANAFRDMLASSIQFPNAPNPLLNIAKAMKYIGGGLANEATGAEIDSFSESKQSLMKIMASGGLAIGDFYGTGQSDNIRSDLGRINSMDSTLNTPDKIEAFYKDNLDFAAGTVKNLWNKWNRVGQTFEQASRINVFEGALANGETHAEAVSQAADVLNFSMRGDFWLIKHIVNSYPFMNARLQGLNVLGRSLRDNTQHVLTRGGSVAAATVALYMINQDNEEYEDLPDYDKDLYWHFFVGGEHFRLPKPFEIGTAFATYPERLVQYSMEEDKGHEFLWEKFKDGVVTALSFDAFPQVVKPLVDVISNKDSFRDMKIVSGALENAPPEQQFNIFTSDTSKSIAQSMPEGAPDYLRSPMMVDYLLRGYFASWSSFGAMVLDPYTRDPSLPDRPEKLVSQYPVVKRFFRSDMTTSKYADLFYDVRGELDNMNREFNGLLENGRTREARDYLNEMGGFDEARKDIRGYYKQIRGINKQRDLIYMDSKLSASRKQQLISKLYEKRNTLFKEAYLKHSQFYPEYGDR